MNCNKRIFSLYSIGMLLMFFYIFASYNGIGIIIGTLCKQIALFAFLACGALVLISTQFGTVSVYTKWYAAFMLVSLITMLYSSERSIMDGQFYLMIVSFFVAYVFCIFINDEKAFTKLSWFYIVSSTFLIITLYYTGQLIGDASARLGEELFGNSNNFACMVRGAVMYGMWLLVYESKKIVTKLILIVGIIFNMYALALSAGRSSFVMPFVFLYLLLLFKRDKRGKKHILVYTVIIGMILVIVYNLILKVPVLYEAIGGRVETFILGATGTGSYDGSAAIRDAMRNDAFKQWFKSPLFGYGFDSYKFRAYELYGHKFYSHCNFTEMLYNGGIIYFCVYYWIHYKLIRLVIKSKNISQKFKAFAVATSLSMVMFDYTTVSYSVAVTQTMLALAFKGLTFQENSI